MKWTKEILADAKIMVMVLVIVVLSLSIYSILNWIFVKINEPTRQVKVEKYEESYESFKSNFTTEPLEEKTGGTIINKQNIARWVHPSIVIIISVIIVVFFLGTFIIGLFTRFF
ncbi:MAG: hypothetical protein SVM86_06080 [Candidatus Cloacimonadota bacterium]|nr:hypothetical protein [Candidatus Cloacimonadota bacterium]